MPTFSHLQKEYQSGPKDKYVKIKLPSAEDVAKLVLRARLEELTIQPDGLPPQVNDHLQSTTEHTVAAVQAKLAINITRLEDLLNSSFRREVAKLITLKSVGRAFGQSTTSGTPKTPEPPQPPAQVRPGGEV